MKEDLFLCLHPGHACLSLQEWSSVATGGATKGRRKSSGINPPRSREAPREELRARPVRVRRCSRVSVPRGSVPPPPRAVLILTLAAVRGSGELGTPPRLLSHSVSPTGVRKIPGRRSRNRITPLPLTLLRATGAASRPHPRKQPVNLDRSRPPGAPRSVRTSPPSVQRRAAEPHSLVRRGSEQPSRDGNTRAPPASASPRRTCLWYPRRLRLADAEGNCREALPWRCLDAQLPTTRARAAARGQVVMKCVYSLTALTGYNKE
ncbi:unnamed protein product [Pleuronectes platessa]|uniref:Uncharacterized protein n=1 Tax=Pleuronectes platessa TaxID=8262 RepID=A0A9N7TSA8_PLEPL|nr:unnamed protein product [Pleuronectes platessa]